MNLRPGIFLKAAEQLDKATLPVTTPLTNVRASKKEKLFFYLGLEFINDFEQLSQKEKVIAFLLCYSMLKDSNK